MAQIELSDVIRGVAVKTLTAVELDPSVSNQHEFNGSRELRTLLGDEDRDTRQFDAKVIYLRDKDDVPQTFEDVQLTWYDARSNHPTRTEWRFYFNRRAVFDDARIGDALFVVRTHDDKILLVITDQDSTYEAQLRWMFSFDQADSAGYQLRTEDALRHQRMGLIEVALLEALGIEVDDSEDNALDLMRQRFPHGFPSTKVFSEFAREYAGIAIDSHEVDDVLVEWVHTEERLFKAFERHLLVPQLVEISDVDRFLSLSLSVQNRRKSRAGKSLENHLAEIFGLARLKFDPRAITENKSRPDFLFPDEASYHDPRFPTEFLYMLGAKSTLKDRWRQVLAEAARISEKHLLTLDVAVSANQLAEMNSNRLQLVVPEPLQVGYAPEQKASLWSLQQFIDEVQRSQRKINL